MQNKSVARADLVCNFITWATLMTTRYLFEGKILKPQFSEELKNKIISASSWLTIEDLSRILKLDTDQTLDLVHSWERDAHVFSVKYQGIQLIPEYAVDPEGKPLPVLKKVLIVFDGKKSSWATAAWFASTNGWLGGDVPKDVIRTKSDELLQAAVHAFNPSEHG